MDYWIKNINRRLSDLEEMQPIIYENIDNTQQNYELIYELKDNLKIMRNDINAIHLILLGLIKNNANRKLCEEKRAIYNEYGSDET